MAYLCLIIERDAGLAQALHHDLQPFGIKPRVVASGDEALTSMRQWSFDAVLIDADSLGAACLQVLRKLQPRVHVPVVLLASASDEQSQLACLESGATDVLAKPASTRLVATKLRRLIEAVSREDEDEASEIIVGPLAMHARRGRATVAGMPLELTSHQFELLFLLASHAGQFVPRETIARVLRGPLKEIGRSADVHVYRIRKKLRDLGVDGLRLDTIYGRGYCLSVDPAEATLDEASPSRPARRTA